MWAMNHPIRRSPGMNTNLVRASFGSGPTTRRFGPPNMTQVPAGLRSGDRAIGGPVEDRVVAHIGLAEVFLLVINDLIGPDPPRRFHVGCAAHGRHLRPQRFRDLDCEGHYA